MSGGKVIFSFLDGINLAVSREGLTDGTVIQFGSGFQDMGMNYDSSALELVNQEEAHNCRFKVDLSVRTEESKKENVQTGKRAAVTMAEVDPHATFHEGIVEKKSRLTKTQKRNRYRQYRRQQEKLEREAEVTKPAVASVIVKDIPADVAQVEEYVPQHVRPRQLLSEDELERFQSVKKQTFEYLQRIRGKWVNILEGLELHTGVFSEIEQKKILKVVDGFKDKGRAGLFRPRTYSEPKKWMRGKGRITIQFGCCYNYTLDAEGNPPGIMQHEEVDPLPFLLKNMIRKLVFWHVLPPDTVPDSSIVNIYEEGDCIPPHVDSHDFLRPFCTVSFLGECDILLGTELKIKGPGEFSGPMRIPLPTGSVFVFKGNGADLAKHCIPGVPWPRVSITFRKMDPNKLPYNHVPEPELQNLSPMIF